MNKFLFLLLFIFGFLFSFPVLAQERINNFDAIIKINKDSTLDIIENIEYNFATNNKHGIYRDIPFRFNVDGKNKKVKITDVSVVDNYGNEYKFEASTFNKYKRIKIGDKDKLVTGQKIYSIKYKVNGALTFFDDFDELYWNITGNEWDVDIDNVKAEIYFEDNLRQEELDISCYSGKTTSIDSCQSSDYLYDYGSVIGAIFYQNNLNNKEGLTVKLSFDKNIV